MKIDRIFSLLVPEANSQPELQHSASRLSVLSRFDIQYSVCSPGDLHQIVNDSCDAIIMNVPMIDGIVMMILIFLSAN